jgi:RNA polymerase sigma-70 factor (ECF subfamily)
MSTTPERHSAEEGVRLGALYARFHHRLRRFVLHRISNESDAEDLVQEVFLRIHARIGTLKDSARIESWIFQIARNLLIDHHRSRKKTEPIHPDNEPPDRHSVPTASERLAPAIREFVNRLPEPYREALTLTEFDGVPQKELARRLGLSISGAKSRVQRARAMVKDMLMRCCHFEFDRYGTIIDYHEIACCCCRESLASHRQSD